MFSLVSIFNMFMIGMFFILIFDFLLQYFDTALTPNENSNTVFCTKSDIFPTFGCCFVSAGGMQTPDCLLTAK